MEISENRKRRNYRFGYFTAFQILLVLIFFLMINKYRAITFLIPHYSFYAGKGLWLIGLIIGFFITNLIVSKKKIQFDSRLSKNIYLYISSFFYGFASLFLILSINYNFRKEQGEQYNLKVVDIRPNKLGSGIWVETEFGGHVWVFPCQEEIVSYDDDEGYRTVITVNKGLLGFDVVSDVKMLKIFHPK